MGGTWARFINAYLNIHIAVLYDQLPDFETILHFSQSTTMHGEIDNRLLWGFLIFCWPSHHIKIYCIINIAREWKNNITQVYYSKTRGQHVPCGVVTVTPFLVSQHNIPICVL